MDLLTDTQINKHLALLPGWKFSRQAICKDYIFRDFMQAMKFMQAVGEIAEKQQHHPEIHNVYNRVSLNLSTHSAGGVTMKDIHLAQAIETLSATFAPS